MVTAIVRAGGAGGCAAGSDATASRIGEREQDGAHPAMLRDTAGAFRTATAAAPRAPGDRPGC